MSPIHPIPRTRMVANASVGAQRKDAKDSKAAQRAAPTPDEMDTLKVKKAWEVALGPIKGLPMTAIMMYMSGNSLQIFSIMMVFMAFKNPIMGILGTNQAFERFETDSNRAKIIQVKLAYVLMQFVALALGIWKVNGMGLLPWVFPLLPRRFLWNPRTDEQAQDNEVGLAGLGSSTRSHRACSACVIARLCLGKQAGEKPGEPDVHMLETNPIDR